MYDVVIIGAGINGALIARELSKYELSVIILEKDNDISNGTTKANSGIIHAGYDAMINTNMSKFNVKGTPLFDKLCGELDVPFKRIGSMVVAFDKEEMNTIEGLYKNGVELNIPGIEMIGGDRVREIEPNLSTDIVGALLAPSAGIINPWELAIGAVENAMDNGVELILNFKVDSIIKEAGAFIIKSQDKVINAVRVVNCAGVNSDEINSMVDGEDFKIIPKRGQYYLLDKSAGNHVNSVIFQCPTKKGKGVLITPTVHGNLLIGPNSEEMTDKGDIGTTDSSLRFVKSSAWKASHNIPFNQVITSFSGVRAEPSCGDFVIGESKKTRGFINVAGMKSPGLSAAPAIANFIVDIIKEDKPELKEKKNHNPYRRPVIRFNELSHGEKIVLIKKNSSYGRIICRCENITEGEIIDAIHRNCGAKSLDGVKRRVRPGSGRCQGGFCSPLVMKIIARELGVDIQDVVKSEKESRIITGITKEMSLYNDPLIRGG